MKFKISTILSCYLFLTAISTDLFLKVNAEVGNKAQNNTGHGQYNTYAHKYSSNSIIYHRHIENKGNNGNIPSPNFDENYNRKFTPVRTVPKIDYANNPFLNPTKLNLKLSSLNKAFANNPFLNPTNSDLAKMSEINNNIRDSNKPFANNPFLKLNLAKNNNFYTTERNNNHAPVTTKSNISQNNGNNRNLSKKLPVENRYTRFTPVRETFSKKHYENNPFFNLSKSDSEKVKSFDTTERNTVAPKVIKANIRKTPSRDDI